MRRDLKALFLKLYMLLLHVPRQIFMFPWVHIPSFKDHLSCACQQGMILQPGYVWQCLEIFFFNNFIYLFFKCLAVQGPSCYVGFSLVPVVTSLVAEHGLKGTWASVVAVPRL